MWLASLITGTCCQRMGKEKAAETCVLSCTLHSYNLVCLGRWLRNSVTQNILRRLYVSMQIIDQLGNWDCGLKIKHPTRN